MNDAAVETPKDMLPQQMRFRKAYIRQRLLDLKAERDALVAERQALLEATKKQPELK